jgi:hypothetical protein
MVIQMKLPRLWPLVALLCVPLLAVAETAQRVYVVGFAQTT